MNQHFRIYTDGSSIGNPGPGGWGAVILERNQRREMFGAFPWTTISETELVAAIEALRSMPRGARIELYSDSELLIYGMRGFVLRWKEQGWRNRRGAALQHRDLWTQLMRLDTELHIQWRWLKGHNGHPLQTRADGLAYRAAKSLLNSQRLAA
jgi:ribonuclease HI